MHLHCHSWFSLRYGLMQPRELLAEAQNAGITTLALTDINNTSAHWDFVRLAPEYGIRPVVGIDFRNKGDDDGLPLYIGLANNPDGYARLCAHLNGHLNEHQSFSDVVPEIQDVAFICPWERWKARLEDSADLRLGRKRVDRSSALGAIRTASHSGQSCPQKSRPMGTPHRTAHLHFSTQTGLELPPNPSGGGSERTVESASENSNRARLRPCIEPR